MLCYSRSQETLTLSGARRGCEAKGANFSSRFNDPLGEYGGAFGRGPYLGSATATTEDVHRACDLHTARFDICTAIGLVYETRFKNYRLASLCDNRQTYRSRLVPMLVPMDRRQMWTQTPAQKMPREPARVVYRRWT
jgi:hypothetical protein